MNKTWKYIVMLLGIFVIHLVVNYQVLTQSQIPRVFDEGSRIMRGFSHYETLFLRADISVQQKIILITRLDKGQAHPLFFEVMEAFALKILSIMKQVNVELMILTVNAFFLAILLFSIYGIGTFLYNKNLGLLAALLASFFPSTFGWSRTAMLDFPLSCMVALSFFLLLKTDRFSSNVYSMLFGAVAGLSVLTKEAAILFLIAPTSYYFIKAYLAGHKRQAIFNMLTALLFFLFVAGMVYFQPDNFHAYDMYVKRIATQQTKPFFYYFQTLPDLIGPRFLILSSPLFVYYFIRPKKQDGFLSLWCLIPILLFSLSPNKAMRFILPIMPAFALILARETLVNSWPKSVRRAYVFALTILSITQYGFYQMGYFEDTGKFSSRLGRGILSVVRQDECSQTVSKLFDVFKNEAPNAGAGKTLFLFHEGEIHDSLRLQLAIARLPHAVSTPLSMDEPTFSSASQTACSEEILGADYVVALEGGAERNPNPVTKRLRNCLNESFSEHKNDFEKITDGIAYNNSLIYVYKRIRR